MTGFDYNKTNFYTTSNNSTYGINTGVVTDPLLLRGKTAIKSHIFPFFIEFLLMGRLPSEILIVKAPTFDILAQDYWGTNIQRLAGRSVDISGAPSMLTVLPDQYHFYQTYEMSRAEYMQTTVAASAMAYSSGTVTFYVAATSDQGGMYPIDRFQLDQVIRNWNHADYAKSRFVITAVSRTDNSVTVKAYGNTAAVTQIIDVFSADAAADAIEIVGSSVDFRNGRLPSTRLARRVRHSPTVKQYYLQQFETMWEESSVTDPSLHYLGALKRPEAVLNSADALHQHILEMSAACLWGCSATVSATTDLSGFSGIDDTIVTNVTTLTNGLLSFSTFDNIVSNQLGMRQGSREYYIFTSPNVQDLVDQLFASLAGSYAAGSVERFMTGIYQMPISIIKYRNFTFHMVPLADFINDGAQTREDLTTDKGVRRAGNMYIVDPAAMHLVLGSHMDRGTLLFNRDMGIQSNEETFKLKRHALRSKIGFALRHEWTSAAVKNIRGIDILG